VHSISGSIEAGTPPCEAWVQAELHTPSGPKILAVGRAALTSLTIWTPPLETMPEKKKQSAPSDLIVCA
jgi:hypothetical protein